MIKNKAFFFANYEGLRQTLGQTLIGFVPSAAVRAQVLTTSPVLKPIIDAFPTRADARRRQHRSDHRAGHQHRPRGLRHVPVRLPVFTTVNSAFVRYSIDNALINNPQDALGAPTRFRSFRRIWCCSSSTSFRRSVINETKFGLNRVNYHNWNYGTSPISVSARRFLDR